MKNPKPSLWIGGPEFAAAIKEAQQRHELPSTVPPRLLQALRDRLSPFSLKFGEPLIGKIIDDFVKLTEACMSCEYGFKSETLYNLTHYVGAEAAEEIRCILDIVSQLCSGLGHYLSQNVDPIMVDEFPALEFKRSFRRPPDWVENDWPIRWSDAGSSCRDLEWLPWEGDSESGRGVALKSSGIWIGLGSNRDATFGYPFPPFIYNSAFRTRNVSRKETEGMGLLKPGEQARMAKIGYDDLFAPVEEAIGTGARPTKV